MSERKHTPGPWAARFIYRMIRAARDTQGLLMATPPENDWPDACLMAASPDLLVACEAAARAFGHLAERARRGDWSHSATEFELYERSMLSVIAKIKAEPTP